MTQSIHMHYVTRFPGCLNSAFLKGVLCASRIGIARCRLVQDMAKVYELALCSGSLGQRASLPFGNELLRCHAGRPNR